MLAITIFEKYSVRGEYLYLYPKCVMSLLEVSENIEKKKKMK